ncbi:transporter [Vibrio diazotrophicus]|jgi:predicted permease|nr:transporter [Vibrio diazotrophicus]
MGVDSLFQLLMFSASITGPICLMLVLGVFLKRINLINDNFIEVASKIVFEVTLPTMLFLSIISSKHDFASSASLIIYGLAANFLFFLLTTFVTKKTFNRPQDQGVIIQGAFRANTAIIAIAYVANAYGNDGVALAAIYVASMTLLYNVQAVIALSVKSDTKGTPPSKIIFRTLTKNPLIIAILFGLFCYGFSIPIPKMVTDAGRYLGNMTLPLALLCTGGSLDLKALKEDNAPAWYATGFKLILAPLLTTLGALMFGFRGMELGLIFLMSSAPTAAASYVMARAMGGNATLAANIIALTTVFSLFSCTLGIFLLSAFNLM